MPRGNNHLRKQACGFIYGFRGQSIKDDRRYKVTLFSHQADNTFVLEGESFKLSITIQAQDFLHIYFDA